MDFSFKLPKQMEFKKCFQIVPNVERLLEYGLVYALYQMFQEDVKKKQIN